MGCIGYYDRYFTVSDENILDFPKEKERRMMGKPTIFKQFASKFL